MQVYPGPNFFLVSQDVQTGSQTVFERTFPYPGMKRFRAIFS